MNNDYSNVFGQPKVNFPQQSSLSGGEKINGEKSNITEIAPLALDIKKETIDIFKAANSISSHDIFKTAVDASQVEDNEHFARANPPDENSANKMKMSAAKSCLVHFTDEQFESLTVKELESLSQEQIESLTDEQIDRMEERLSQRDEELNNVIATESSLEQQEITQQEHEISQQEHEIAQREHEIAQQEHEREASITKSQDGIGKVAISDQMEVEGSRIINNPSFKAEGEKMLYQAGSDCKPINELNDKEIKDIQDNPEKLIQCDEFGVLFCHSSQSHRYQPGMKISVLKNGEKEEIEIKKIHVMSDAQFEEFKTEMLLFISNLLKVRSNKNQEKPEEANKKVQQEPKPRERMVMPRTEYRSDVSADSVEKLNEKNAEYSKQAEVQYEELRLETNRSKKKRDYKLNAEEKEKKEQINKEHTKIKKQLQVVEQVREKRKHPGMPKPIPHSPQPLSVHSFSSIK